MWLSVGIACECWIIQSSALLEGYQCTNEHSFEVNRTRALSRLNKPQRFPLSCYPNKCKISDCSRDLIKLNIQMTCDRRAFWIVHRIAFIERKKSGSWDFQRRIESQFEMAHQYFSTITMSLTWVTNNEVLRFVWFVKAVAKLNIRNSASSLVRSIVQLGDIYTHNIRYDCSSPLWISLRLEFLIDTAYSDGLRGNNYRTRKHNPSSRVTLHSYGNNLMCGSELSNWTLWKIDVPWFRGGGAYRRKTLDPDNDQYRVLST